MRLLQNHHPKTGEQLTAGWKKKAKRRLYFDATVSAPNPWVIMALTMKDERLAGAHEKAVAFAVNELQYLLKPGSEPWPKWSPQIPWNSKCSIHPHHLKIPLIATSHPQCDFQRNFWSRRTAVQSAWVLFYVRTLKLHYRAYRNELAREVRALGYEIERVKHGWEIKGVSKTIQELFSKRSAIL